MEKTLKIVFLGTPEFAIQPLEALINAGYQISGVITAPDKPAGRKMILTPPPAKIVAEKHKLPVYQPRDKNELLEMIKRIRPDLAVVAAFGMIFTKEILDIPKYGFLNIHASLLPRWRGASPIQSAILAGDEKTGVTIMLVNEKMDEGDIVAISNLKSQISNLNYKELEKKLSGLGAGLLVETIPKWINGEIKLQEQEHSKATYCKKITKEDGLIDFGKEPAKIIKRKIRAFTLWPGTYIFSKGKRIIITEADLIKCNTCEESNSSRLKIKRVKPEGKNEMNFADYLRGNPDEFLKKFL